MGMLYDIALLVLGTWLLLYRVPLRTKALGKVSEKLTTICCGLALALLAPLLPWPPPSFRTLPLALLGVLFAFCHPALTAMVVTMPLGVAFGALVWQLGLCSTFPTGHFWVLTVTELVLVGAFVCTPGLAGLRSLQLVLVPALSALLLTTALAGLVPSMGTLTPRELMLASPCAADSGNLQAPLIGFGLWLLVALLAILLQLLLVWVAGKLTGKRPTGPGGDLVASLLPGAQPADDGEDGGFKMPNDAYNERFQMLVKAIFDHDADLSQMTENERKMVQICREDEFERDRLMWGGGLI